MATAAGIVPHVTETMTGEGTNDGTITWIIGHEGEGVTIDLTGHVVGREIGREEGPVAREIHAGQVLFVFLVHKGCLKKTEHF